MAWWRRGALWLLQTRLQLKDRWAGMLSGALVLALCALIAGGQEGPREGELEEHCRRSSLLTAGAKNFADYMEPFGSLALHQV